MPCITGVYFVRISCIQIIYLCWIRLKDSIASNLLGLIRNSKQSMHPTPSFYPHKDMAQNEKISPIP